MSELVYTDSTLAQAYDAQTSADLMAQASGGEPILNRAPGGQLYRISAEKEAEALASIAALAKSAPQPPTYVDLRRPLYRKELAALKGEPGMDEVGVIGFQLDAIFTQLATLAGGVGNMTPEMQGIITKVQEVKAAVPKP